MQSLGSVASIIAAIREDTAAEVDRIEEASAVEIAAARAEGAAVVVAIPDREVRLAAARAENEERIARQEWEGQRMALEQREQWIDRVIARAREKQRTNGAQLAALIREALQKIETPECEIAVAERDRALIDAKKLGKAIRVTTAAIDGGCIVTAGDLVFDNSLEARARRLESAWRSALSEVYKP
jgi:vacuolar-type H+-ATPase subunit E/Vma4